MNRYEYKRLIELTEATERIRRILWLEPRTPTAGEWNPDKEWSPDTLDQIADVIATLGLRPTKRGPWVET